MTRIIEKRLSLHKQLQGQQQHNNALKAQISRLQALANIGTATCMIAHEISNLLTPVAAYAAVALKNPDDQPLAEKALQRTLQNCQHASKIMESILALANGETLRKENVRLTDLVKEIFTCLARDFSKDKITVKIHIPEDLTVWAIPVQIQQVLMNVILNARDAMLPHGGVLTIRAEPNDNAVCINVADTGSGIKPADLEKIFEPFYTTKTGKNSPSRHCGSGFGLVFCKEIINAHNGCISAESEPANGTIFTITMPNSQ